MGADGAPPCSSRGLSWDGILCFTCRELFDELVRDKNKVEHDSMLWHTSQSFQNCVAHMCRICMLISAIWRGDNAHVEVDVPLRATVLDRKVGTTTIMFNVSEDVEGDSRPLIIPTIINFQGVHSKDAFSFRDVTAATTGSTETTAKIASWLRACEEGHNLCSSWQQITGSPSQIPTRLLEINAEDDSLHICLVLGKNILQGSRYATLSHCWGASRPVILTKGTLGSFQDDIPFSILPQTFQEAVQVANGLGIQYLWIDSLCILQDSAVDWRAEAGRMASVYSNSTLTIAADASRSGEGGLFRNHDPEINWSTYIPCSSSSSPRALDNSYEGFCAYANGFEASMDYAPLNTRAWVVQERFLSPRVVHFSSDQVHWECLTLMSSEGLPDSFEMSQHLGFPGQIKKQTPAYNLLLEPGQRKHEIYQEWNKMVEKYSECNLSFLSDKPTAIAGLARAFCSRLELKTTDYLCGLWRPHFIISLNWYQAHGLGDRPSERLYDSGTPSWSWLSVSKRASYQSKDPTVSLSPSIPIASLLEASTTPIEDLFGPVTSGIAKVKGPLCQATLRLNDLRYRLSFGSGVELLESQDSFMILGDTHRQSFRQDALDNEIYLFMTATTRIAHRRWASKDKEMAAVRGMERMQADFDSRAGEVEPRRSGDYYQCLILVPCEPRGQFRRIGQVDFNVHALVNDSKTSKRALESETESEMYRLGPLLDEHFKSEKMPRERYEQVDANFFYTITLI